MKHQVKIYALLSVIAGLFIITGMQGCKEDACKGVTCGTGSCNDGKCVCPYYYEGTHCETETRAKFIAVYTGTTTVGSFPAAPTTITVTNGPDSISEMTMTINNAAINGSGTGVAIGGNSIYIPNQTIGGFTISGTGSLSGKTMYDTLNITGLGTGYFVGDRP